MAAEERLKILRESPPNSWLAFSEDESRLVSRGATYAEAVAQAEADGVTDPVLVRQMIGHRWCSCLARSIQNIPGNSAQSRTARRQLHLDADTNRQPYNWARADETI